VLYDAIYALQENEFNMPAAVFRGAMEAGLCDESELPSDVMRSGEHRRDPFARHRSQNQGPRISAGFPGQGLDLPRRTPTENAENAS
jgi:hypothetical protein